MEANAMWVPAIETLDGKEFSIGCWKYRVKKRAKLRIYDGLSKGGEPAAGLCDWPQRLIWLSSDPIISAESRWDTFLHEYRHAWRKHFGQPMNPEEDADAFAVQAASLINDLIEQRVIGVLKK